MQFDLQYSSWHTVSCVDRAPVSLFIESNADRFCAKPTEQLQRHQTPFPLVSDGLFSRSKPLESTPDMDMQIYAGQIKQLEDAEQLAVEQEDFEAAANLSTELDALR